MDDSAIVRGKVLRENDVPVAGLPLDYYGRTSSRVVTGDDGSFEFSAFEGPYTIYVDSGEAIAHNIFNPGGSQIDVLAGQNISNLVIRVRTTSVLVHGFVKDSSGAPVAQIPISFWIANRNDYGIGITDDSGEYTIRLYPGGWTGGPDISSLNERGYLSVLQQNYSFEPGDYTVNFTVARPEIPVTGVVQNELGAPIPNFTLIATSYTGPGPLNGFTTRSDNDGNFTFKLSLGKWQIGSEYSQETYDRGLTPLKYEILVPESGLTTNIVIPRSASKIEGIIQTSNGLLLTNIGINAETTFNGVRLWQYATSDTNGSFSLRVSNGSWKVNPSTYDLNLRGFEAPSLQTITVFDETNTTVVFTVIPPSSFLRGTIRDETGATASNLVVRASTLQSTFSATSDQEGNFSIPVAPGKWYVSLDEAILQQRGYIELQNAEVTVPDGVESVSHDIEVLKAPYQITVHIIDENGDPLATGSGYPQFTYASTTHNGQNLTILGIVQNGIAEYTVSSGDWWIYLQLQSSEFKPIGGRLVSVATASVDLNVVAQRWIYDSTITGQVLDENGDPVTNIIVEASGPVSVAGKGVDAAGHFTFSVPSAHWALRSHDTNYLYSSSYFFVPPATITNRNILAHKIDSQLIIHLNHPGTGALECYSISARQRVGNATFSSWGSATDDLVNIPLFSGEWILSFSACGGMVRPIADQIVSVTSPEKTLTIDLVSAAPTAVVRGTVVEPSGAPIAGSTVWASNRGRATNTNTGADGRFALGLYGTNWDANITKPGGFIAVTKAFHVLDDQDQDWGTIVIPDSTALVHIILVDTNDVPLPISNFNFASATQISGAISYFSSDSGYNNERILHLTPGSWELVLSAMAINQLGFAAVQPFQIDVPPGDSERRVTVHPLPANIPAPVFSVAPGLPSFRRIRLTYDLEGVVEFQSSTDLKTWTYHSTQWISGYADIVLPDAESEPGRFFRASLIE